MDSTTVQYRVRYLTLAGRSLAKKARTDRSRLQLQSVGDNIKRRTYSGVDCIEQLRRKPRHQRLLGIVHNADAIIHRA